MFTGIVEEVGRILDIRRSSQAIRLTIQGQRVFEDISLGCSIAVNGICLTVTSFTENTFTADVMPTSVKVTTLGQWRAQDKVNLERALAANGRFGGHMVAGHVDGVGTVQSVTQDENSRIITIATTPDVLEYIIYKGSIAIDGISLTVSAVHPQAFSVSVIPHTLQETTLATVAVGRHVNLETDITGRYIRHFIERANTTNTSASSSTSNTLAQALRDNGFLS